MKYKTERGQKIADSKKLSTDEFISRCNLTHKNKYVYSKVIYHNAHTHVTITCPTHGDWQQAPLSHLAGKGCAKCGNIQKGISKKKSSYNKFLLIANSVHNGKYTYCNDTFIGITKPMKIICPMHGEFMQSPDVHKRAGCQRCGSGPVSESSQRWLDSLNIHKDYRERWILINSKRLKVDAMDHNTNTIYEYLGDYWHGNPAVYNPLFKNANNKKLFGELYSQTTERLELIKSAGYNLIFIWENDWLKSIRDASQ